MNCFCCCALQYLLCWLPELFRAGMGEFGLLTNTNLASKLLGNKARILQLHDLELWGSEYLLCIKEVSIKHTEWSHAGISIELKCLGSQSPRLSGQPLPHMVPAGVTFLHQLSVELCYQLQVTQLAAGRWKGALMFSVTMTPSAENL